MLDIDQVVAKNFPKVAAKSWLFSKPVKSALRMLFHERELQKFQAQYPHLQGLDFVEQILEHFDFSYTINAKELERIPSTGRVVIVANHPLGTLDAAVLLKLVGQVRTDVKAVANQVLSSIKPIHSLLLPVDNMGGHTKPSQLKAVYQHLQHEGAVIIFPAGDVSRLGASGIKDGKWNRSFLQISSASRSPILPIYVNGRNSAFFYALSWLARPLSTLWLVREMYKQAKRSVAVSIGKLIAVEALDQVKLPMDAKAKLMKKHLYRLDSHKPALFATTSPIAHPEKRQVLRQELQACERLGQTQDGKQIYLAEYRADSSLMREIGRLREIAFRAVGEGTGLRRDVDKYDAHCFQLVLWDEKDLEIVGAYRLCKIQQVLDASAEDAPLYSQTLFDFSPAMQPIMQQGLELGRSFVQPRYWGRRSLDYLWYGTGAFLRQHPEYRYLLGVCVFR